MTLSRTVLALIVLAAPLLGQSTHDLADELVRELRGMQNADGSYGSSLIDTCRVLDELSRAPRRYCELDGPFFRVPARAVARAPADPRTDAWVVLALANAVTGELSDARDAALHRLRSRRSVAGYAEALAQRTFPDPSRTWEAPAEATDPGLACLLAADPSAIRPPPLDDQAAWNRWARAARLRGLRPDALPPLPRSGPRPDLQTLLADLETTIQMHGLYEAPRQADMGTVSIPARVDAPHDLAEAREHAWQFLELHQRQGTFGMELPGSDGPEPGITALCLTASLDLCRELGHDRPAWIGQGLDYLVSLQRGDGSIAENGLTVYTTATSVEALLTAARPADRPVIERARDYLIAAQADEGEGYRSDEDVYYGGVGYGDDERPDLSNTQYAMEIVARAGTPPDDPFFAKARIFLERCQNHSEQQTESWPRPGGGTLVKGNDGGATYMPGSSKAGEVEVAPGVYQARSYGSMSYALLKSYLFAGLSADDPRVQAAVGWLATHFTVDSNPGFQQPAQGYQGLYYYYLAMSRALRLLPERVGVRDASGELIPWRAALQDKLLGEQRTDGSWINEDSARWWEGAPTLCTAYAVLTLSAAESGS